MGDLIFNGDDMRGLFGVMLDALTETRKAGSRPGIVVNGKRIAPFDLVKVAQMMPDTPLSDEDQARLSFRKKQKSYKVAAYTLAMTVNGIPAANEKRERIQELGRRASDGVACVQPVDTPKSADDVQKPSNFAQSPSPPKMLIRLTADKRVERLLSYASAITDRSKLRGPDRINMSRIMDELRALGREVDRLTTSKPKTTLDDVIRADPSRSDRDIARQFGCSPTTVGKARARLGLDAGERSVQRGGQMYRMKRRGTVPI